MLLNICTIPRRPYVLFFCYGLIKVQSNFHPTRYEGWNYLMFYSNSIVVNATYQGLFTVITRFKNEKGFHAIRIQVNPLYQSLCCIFIIII